MPQLDYSTYLSQIFWLFLSFFLLWGGMRRWVLPLFDDVIKKRADTLEELTKKTNLITLDAQKIRENADKAFEKTVRDITQKRIDDKKKHLFLLEGTKQALDLQFQEQMRQLDSQVQSHFESIRPHIKEHASVVAKAIVDRFKQFDVPATEGISDAILGAKKTGKKKHVA